MTLTLAVVTSTAVTAFALRAAGLGPIHPWHPSGPPEQPGVIPKPKHTPYSLCAL